MTLKELQKRIRPAFDREALTAAGLEPEEIDNYMQYKLFPIELLVPAEWNYKEEDEGRSEKLRNNIKRNGQIENIIVRKLATGYYEVGNGNHRLFEFQKLGRKMVMAYDCGEVSVSTMQRIAIETNETKFAADMARMGIIMADLMAEFDDLEETMPFTGQQMKAFGEIDDFDWDQFDNEERQPRDFSGTPEIRVKVSQETYNVWLKWLEAAGELGARDEAAAIELACTRALSSIPPEVV